MVQYPITPERSALVLFDMVNDFLLPGAPLEIAGAAALVARLVPLVATCHDRGMLVVYVKPRGYAPDNSDLGQLTALFPERQQRKTLIYGTPGVDIHSDLAPRPEALVQVKRGYSAFLHTDLEATLRARGVDTLVVGGVASNIGCDTFAREAFVRQFRVALLSDGSLTRPLRDLAGAPVSVEEIHRVLFATFAYAFGPVVSVDDVIRQITDTTEQVGATPGTPH
jgi:ureidoacrylate peracid hydrolase